MRIFSLICVVIVGLLFTNCKKENQDISPLEYLAKKGLVEKATELDRGVYIIFNKTGVGEKPTITDKININYKGFLTNGNTFDSGNDVKFNLSRLIPGWQIGIPQMPVGSSATLVIPASQGYGSRAVGNIPENSTLIFDIDLLGIE